MGCLQNLDATLHVIQKPIKTSVSGKLRLFLFRQLTSRTENDPLVDDIITLCSVLSIAKVIRARLS